MYYLYSQRRNFSIYSHNAPFSLLAIVGAVRNFNEICVMLFAAGYVSIQAAIIVDILGVKHAEIGTGLFIFFTAVSYLIMHSTSGM